MVRAVILAAGASTRMGVPKATLTVAHPADTFVSRLVERFLAAGLPDIVIVTGAAEQGVRRAIGKVRAPVRFVHNPRWADGQLTSLIAGLQERRGESLEAAMVSLVDAPFVTVDTVRRVLAAWRSTRAPIVRPARGGEHGHPVIFDRWLFDELRAADPRVGAKALVRARAQQIVNVPIEDPGAFTDIDTPGDYQRALRALIDSRS